MRKFAVSGLIVASLLAVASMPVGGSAQTSRLGSPVTISVGLSASAAPVGTTVYVQGNVFPATVTPRVVVQRFVNGAWRDRDAGPVNPTTGAFKIAIRPSQAGTYALRARSNGGSLVSDPMFLKVLPVAPPLPS